MSAEHPLYAPGQRELAMRRPVFREQVPGAHLAVAIARIAAGLPLTLPADASPLASAAARDASRVDER